MIKNKKVTIEDLAVMVNCGFNGVDKRFDGVDKRFNIVDKRFDKVEDRLDRIEKLLITDHRRRIEKLESEVRELKNLLAVK